MSMTLALWKAPIVDDPREAQSLLDSYLEAGNESAFEPSADLGRMTDELLRILPYDGSDESPWSDPPTISDRVVLLDIRWGADDAVLDTILDLAREHELVLYDSQGPDVHCPPWASDGSPREPPAPSLGEYGRILGLGAVGVLLAVGGWVASIPVVSWLVIAAGAFVAILAAVLLVVAVRHSLFDHPIQ